MITDDNLRQIMPNLPQQKRADYLPFLTQAMEEFGITTSLRQAAFLAQVAHESAEFRFMEEIWGPTQAQRRYEGRRDLGNTQTGDGFRFKGRGPIQITGRANYQKYGQLLGVDLISDPPIAATKEVAFRIAGVYWKNNGLNELADQQMFKTITKRINGGFNGLDDRVKYYNRAKSVLGIAATRAVGSSFMPEDTGDDSALPLFTRGAEATAEAASAGGADVEERAPKSEKKKAAKKASAKKASASKAGAKKAGAKKTAKKSAAKKSGAKKTAKAGTKIGAKKSGTKKSSAAKASASKASVKKAGAKKAGSKKGAAKKGAAKKGSRKG